MAQKKTSLLQKAKEFRVRCKHVSVSDEEVELALAWCRNEVTITQVSTALGINVGNTYTRLAYILRHFVTSPKRKYYRD